jgi:hypothetical protein
MKIIFEVIVFPLACIGAFFDGFLVPFRMDRALRRGGRLTQKEEGNVRQMP